MAQGERDLTDRVARTAAELLTRRDWRLIGPAAWPGFVAEVAQQVVSAAAGPPDTAQIDRAVVTAYCSRWYAACTAAEPERQQRAWLELHRRVCGVALRFVDRAELEDAAQSVLVHVYEKLDTVREPGSFLRWVDQVARNWCIDHYYRARTAAAPLDEEWTPAPHPPERGVAASEHAHLEALIQRCLRSRRQQRVIVGRLLHQRSVEDLAEELGTTPGNIRVLAHRATARLKDCTELQAYLRATQAHTGETHDPGRSLRERRMAMLTCAECQRLLPHYVELAAGGGGQDARYPSLWPHLAAWHACTLEYVDLLELARDAGPDPAFPPPDLGFLSR